MRRFDLLTTDLGHALVVCDLTQMLFLSFYFILAFNCTYIISYEYMIYTYMLNVIGPGGTENIHAHQWSGGKTTPETHEKHEGMFDFLA